MAFYFSIETKKGTVKIKELRTHRKKGGRMGSGKNV